MFQKWVEVKGVKYHTCHYLTAGLSNFSLFPSLLTWFLELPFYGCSDHPVITSLGKKQAVSEMCFETLNWIDSFLCCRKQRVAVNGKTLERAPVLSGVPQ